MDSQTQRPAGRNKWKAVLVYYVPVATSMLVLVFGLWFMSGVADDVGRLRDDLAASNLGWAYEQETSAELQAALDTAEREVSAAIRERDNSLWQQGRLDAKVEEMEGERAALSRQVSLLERQVDVLEGEVAVLETETSALKERELTAEQEAALLERIEALTQEVEDLEGKRKALLVAWRDRYTTGVACTGSMEPKITCLDQVTILRDFRPQDITVGAIINYWKFSDRRGDEDPQILHRVESIKQVDGVYHYLTKGDAVDELDGWVSEEDVMGYLVELHKDVAPWNADLRDWVMESKAKNEEAEAAYIAKAVEFCGSFEAVDDCDTSDENMDVLREWYFRHVSAWCSYDSALWRAENPHARYTPALSAECWRANWELQQLEQEPPGS